MWNMILYTLRSAAFGLVAVLSVLLFVSEAHATVVYQTNFSTDPHIITDDPAGNHWDQATSALAFHTVNGPQGAINRYAAIPTPLNPSHSFTLTWRQITVSPAPTSVVPFGILNSALVGQSSSSPNDDGYLSVFSSVFQTNDAHFGYRVFPKDGYSIDGANGLTSAFVFEQGKWYQGKLVYDAVAQTISYGFTKEETNEKVVQTTPLSGYYRPFIFGTSTRYIGMSMYVVSENNSVSATYPGSAQGFIDDIKLEDDSVVTPPPPPTGASNVLFLPGIESSGLYKKRSSSCVVNCEDQLWTPNADSDVQYLYMNPDGTSAHNDIYTRDIVNQYPTGPFSHADVYKTFGAYMDGLVASGTIAEWKPAPYDWRLSPKDLVNGGVVRNDGTISYTDTATSSYMVNQVLALASTSKSGKVSIVAHSNGGLVAKELINKLISMGKGDLIDNLILVASPQLGTPKAIPAMLHGYDQANGYGLVTAQQTARTLARNMPDAYYLLPSTRYENQAATPVITFDPRAQTTAHFRSVYGNSITSKEQLNTFILGQDGRPFGDVNDTNVPLKGNPYLLANANTEHDSVLDAWTPPSTLKVYQLAGTGVLTLESVKYVDDCSFYCAFSAPRLSIEAVNSYDGDGTVISTSATGGFGEKWYFNADSYNHSVDSSLAVEHSTIMSAPQVLSFVKNTLTKSTTSISFISVIAPDFSTKAHTVLRAHSPVSLDVYDDQGRHTGLIAATSSDGIAHSYIENGIPGVTYDLFGEVKYIYNDANIPLHVIMKGTGSGYLTYDMQQMIGKNIVASSTFVNIPVTTSTNISVTASPIVNNSSPLLVDQNGDGRTDVVMRAQGVQYYDVTPPDVALSFSTTTKSLMFTPSDASPVTVATTSTSALFTDTAGNTTQLVFSKYKITPKKIELTISKVTQNGVVVSSTPIPLVYSWNTQMQKGTVTFQTLASYVKTATATTETHYRPKKNVTVVMTKPIELGDSDDGDDIDLRPMRQTLSGQHLISLNIVHGIIGVSY